MARDLGPRLLSFAIGYSGEVFTYGMNYSFVPCTAPFVGAIIGGAIYDILIFTGDSPFNRKHFGLDEWRWKKTMLNPVDEIADALPDKLVPSKTRNESSEISKDDRTLSPSDSHTANSNQDLNSQTGYSNHSEQKTDASHHENRQDAEAFGVFDQNRNISFKR